MTFSELWRRAKYAVMRDRLTGELEEEMRLHLELREEQLHGEKQLHGSEDAGARARRQFGNEVDLVERSRDEWGARWLDTLVQDWRHGVRSLRHSMSLTIVIVVTLALVIGSNTTIFGLLNALFLQRLSLPHAENITAVYALNHGQSDDINMDEYAQIKSGTGVPPLAAYWIMSATVESARMSEDISIDMVSGDFLELLGVRPMFGRIIDANDDATAAPVAMISESFWKRHYNGSASVLGQVLKVNGHDATIVGVLPESFHSIHFARTFNVAMPLHATAFSAYPVYRNLLGMHLVSRIDKSERKRRTAALDAAYRSCCVDGYSADPADKLATRAVAATSAREPSPPDAPNGLGRVQSRIRTPHIEVADASHGVTWSVDYRATYRRVLIGVSVGVFILLLIACANIATLLLARAVTREREFAVQLSMGASRSRVVRQLVAESLALAVTGCILGLFVARAGTMVLVRHLPASASQLRDVLVFRPSPATLLWTAATGVLCTLLFGMWPARHGGRADILTPLKGSHARVENGRIITLDRALVVTQIALALVLVCAGSLLATSLRNLSGKGIDGAQSVALVRLDGTGTRYKGLGEQRMMEDAINAAKRAGANHVAAAYDAPLIDDVQQQTLPREGTLTSAQSTKFPSRLDVVTPDFFNAAGIAVKAGRGFDTSDRAGAELVAVVSERFAQRFFGRTNVVGSTIDMGYDSARVYRIVGVAADAPYDDPRAEDHGMFYTPLSQAEARGGTMFTLLVRSSGTASDLTGIRTSLTSTMPDVKIKAITTMAAQLDSLLARERLAAILASLFGGLSLALVAVGVYGLLSHNTVQRTHEIGVRMALGAGGYDAVWLVMGQTLGLVAVGTGIGLPLAFAFGRVVRSQLFGVSPASPVLLGGGALLLLAVATLASVVPSTRAARVSPLVALRSD